MQLRSQQLHTILSLSFVLALGFAPEPVQAVNTASELVSKNIGSGFLKVVGEQIQDEQGHPIHLRGVNINTYYYQYQWDKTAPLKHATEADIHYLKSLGVIAIRLSLHWQYFQTDLGYQLIDNYVKWCENAGIYLILDMHVVPTETAVGQGQIWLKPEAQQSFVDLWKAIATRYANTKIIAGFDLFNEPSPAQPQKWWDLANTTINTIRAVDNKHLIFLEPALTGDKSLQLVNDKNVVYSFHDYQPYIISHAGYAGASDSAVPKKYTYPGLVLKDVYSANWAKGFNIIKPVSTWTQIESHEITVPANMEFAALRIAATGNIGNS